MAIFALQFGMPPAGFWGKSAKGNVMHNPRSTNPLIMSCEFIFESLVRNGGVRIVTPA
jgi:hypothetical protein